MINFKILIHQQSKMGFSTPARRLLLALILVATLTQISVYGAATTKSRNAKVKEEAPGSPYSLTPIRSIQADQLIEQVPI